MKKEEIERVVESQRKFFLSGCTLSVEYRRNALRRLRDVFDKYSGRLQEALKEDLGKSGFESDMCEIRLSRSEISYMLKHLSSFARDKSVPTPLAHFHSRSYRKPSPYGNVLILSPWNYPVLLSIEPIADALAAGNTVILKPSAYSPATTGVLAEMLREAFPPEYVAVVEGGREENSALLECKFDYIFFTGSKNVGRLVMKKAAEHLTPVTLELGGKSPVVVDETASLPLAARRLVFGKYLNLGQTCVAPDYVLVQESVRERFLEEVKKEIKRQFGEDALRNPDYGKIINEKHYRRVLALLDEKKIVHGGRHDDSALKLEPTVMDQVTMNDRVMGEEIFGPIMPVISYRTLDEAIGLIRSLDHPLAFYVFSSSRKNIRRLTSELGFGGGCINDTIVHLSTPYMGFGGFGESGMGEYHGKNGFDTFSHYKSILDKKRWLDLPMRYQKYTDFYHSLIRMFLR